MVHELSFDLANDVALAVAGGVDFAGDLQVKASDLGPLAELHHAGIPLNKHTWLNVGRHAELMRAMAAGKKWFSAPGNQGFVTMPEILAQHSDWTEFAMRGKKAAVEAGFAPDTAGQLFGAIGELRGNIEEHSENTGSGYTAYEAKDRLQTNESPMRPLGPKDNVSPRHATRAGAPHSGTDLESWQPVGRD